MSRVVRPVHRRHVDHGMEKKGGERSADELYEDVAGYTLPGKVPTKSKSNADSRIQVGARYLAHEQYDGHDGEGRSYDGCLMADHAGKGVAHHPASGCRQDQEERTEQLGEEASPLLPGIVEITDPLDDALLVTSNWTERGNLLSGGNLGSPFSRPWFIATPVNILRGPSGCWISEPADPDRRHDMAETPTPEHALDHVVVVLFENRSFDNVLGRLYGPGDRKTFEGVIGKELSNPIPEWAEHGADRKVVPYGVSHRHGLPQPGLGRGVVPHQHATVQHDRRPQPVQDRRGRDRTVERAAARCDADHGRVRHRLHRTFTGEVGRQPTYDEYAQIMTGYTPEQLPVLSGLPVTSGCSTTGSPRCRRRRS